MIDYNVGFQASLQVNSQEPRVAEPSRRLLLSDVFVNWPQMFNNLNELNLLIIWFKIKADAHINIWEGKGNGRNTVNVFYRKFDRPSRMWERINSH